MTKNTGRAKQAKLIRNFRKVHRTTGVLLFVLFIFISVSGILLTWKKNSGGLILAKSQTGTSTELSEWLTIDSLHAIAFQVYHDSISAQKTPELDKIDVRQSKGMIKFVFEEGYWGIQLDGATGELLQIERRWSDLIENIHDGSVLDHWFRTDGWFKLIYSSVAGLSLLLFCITGFWLWYGPKRMRKNSER
ncbi:PepSY-associated TM helix domain-containing protein [Draconibacterium halophilum]|uniref:PepSY domain-containing protein n=1 Tax=Draconibacterium halophilum TaxID=2706887 RepID=A0A6C0RGC8_9BACT|nr:PepSY-associated TM helix domain-containing protein [Draconibacterium halophilum]QIA09768.1 PepSY domain-containing protein [Draconibacterium halophilum]